MSNYDKLIKEEAVDFLKDHRDMIVQALLDGSDFDYNEIYDLDRAWHESIRDRSYNTNDARWILENCENEEGDNGLWEGQDYDQATQTKAAYSFSNDVWFSAKEIYEDLKSEYEQALEEKEDEDSEDEDGLAAEKEIANKVFDSFFAEDEVTPLTQGSKEEYLAFVEWYDLGERVSRSGYPVGQSYIDARCGAMYDTPEYDYVELDRKIVKTIPRIKGKRRSKALEIVRETNPFVYDWWNRKQLLRACETAFHSSDLSAMIGYFEIALTIAKEAVVTWPVEGDYVQLRHDGRRSENFVYVGSVVKKNKNMFLIIDNNNEARWVKRNESFDTDEKKAWVEVIP